MEKSAKINANENCLLITLSGDQTYVKIFSSHGELLRHSTSSKTTKIEHTGEPGDYKIETDGKIKKIESTSKKIDSILDSTGSA